MTVDDVSIEFRVLGPVEVWRQGSRLPIGGARQQGALAVLVLNCNRVVSLEQLITHLGGRQLRDARGALQRQISRLRQVLCGRLVTRPGGYLLAADPDEVDLHRFERLVREGRAAQAAGEQRRAADLLTEGLALWRGPALTGVADSVRDAPAARLEEARLRAIEDQIELRIALGEHERLVAELGELVAAHPIRERLAGLLMDALHRSQRQAEALEVYARTRQRLVGELGLEPGDALRRRQSVILSGASVPARQVPTGQVPAGQVPARPVPARPVPEETPAQLPADLATFTGRSAELAQLLALAGGDSPAVVISAIDGMAGVGKTSLAIHVAHRIADRYPEGQLFVDLHGFTAGVDPAEPADVLVRLLRSLGVAGEQIPQSVEDRAALWRTRLADRRMLIVLDNAAGEAQVRPLLPGATGCLVLITSRRRLAGLDDAHLVSVDVLPAADAIALFTRAAGADRLGGQPGDLVGEIADLCGRLPLAIRIAAARLRHRSAWTLAHLADRLRDQHDRLAELDGGERSVAAGLDLSYTHLDAEQRLVFRFLGLHPGPDIGAGAAAALVGIEVAEARRRLEELVDAHLLLERHPGRYRFHDLVRAHAVRTCAAAEPESRRQEALVRLFDHYAGTATGAAGLAYPLDRTRVPRWPAEIVALDNEHEAVRWLDAEIANLLATAEHGASRHRMHMSAILHRHLLVRGRYAEAEVLHNRALRAARDLGDRLGQRRALSGLGTVHRRRGQYVSAAGYFRQAHHHARVIGDRIGEIDALNGLGTVHRMLSRLDLAAESYQRGLDLARAVGDQVGERAAHLELAAVLRTQRDYAPAIVHLERALELAREGGDRLTEHAALTRLGRIHALYGGHAVAAGYFRRALDATGGAGDTSIEANTICALGDALRLLGRSDEALTNYQQALDMCTRIGDRNGQFEALYGLGHSHLAAGDSGLALSRLQRAFELADELDQRDDQVRAHHGLAEAYHALGKTDRAVPAWREALDLLDSLGLDAVEEVTAADLRASLKSAGL